MTTTTALLFLSLTAMPGMAGVIVGHPVPTTTKFHPSVDVIYAEVPVQKLLLTNTIGETHEQEVYATMDLLGPSSLEMPPGIWTEATLILDGPVRIGGHGADGTFDLELEVGAIFFDLIEPVCTDHGVPPTTAFRFGYDDWLSADLLQLVDDQHVMVSPAHPLHDTLSSALQFGSSWH